MCSHYNCRLQSSNWAPIPANLPPLSLIRVRPNLSISLQLTSVLDDRSGIREWKVDVDGQKHLMASTRKNVFKMTVFVISAFAACWTPYFVISMIRIYSGYHFKLKWPLVLAELLGLLHSAINPVVYIACSSTLICHAFRSGRARKRPRSELDSQMEFATFRATSGASNVTNGQVNNFTSRKASSSSYVESLLSASITQRAPSGDLYSIVTSDDVDNGCLESFRTKTLRQHLQATLSERSRTVRERKTANHSVTLRRLGRVQSTGVRCVNNHIVERLSTM